MGALSNRDVHGRAVLHGWLLELGVEAWVLEFQDFRLQAGRLEL